MYLFVLCVNICSTFKSSLYKEVKDIVWEMFGNFGFNLAMGAVSNTQGDFGAVAAGAGCFLFKEEGINVITM